MAINRARFTINATPSEDPVTGDRGFDAIAGQTLTVTLEQNPARVLNVTYSLPDANDSEAPLSSLFDTPQVFVQNGQSSITLTNPNDAVTITINALTEVSSYVLRCKVEDDTGTHVFERMIAVRTANIRMTVPAERNEYGPRGWSDALNELARAVQLVDTNGAAFVDEENIFTETNHFNNPDPDAARIDSTTTGIMVLMFESIIVTSPVQKLRYYSNQSNASWLRSGLLMTTNARWSSSGSQWVADDNTQPAAMMGFDINGEVLLYYKAVTNPSWGLTDWDKVSNKLFRDGVGLPDASTKGGGAGNPYTVYGQDASGTDQAGGDIILRPGAKTGAGVDGVVRMYRDSIEWNNDRAPILKQALKTTAGAATPFTIESQTVTSGGAGPAEPGGNIVLACGDGAGSSDPGEVQVAPKGNSSIVAAFKPNNDTTSRPGGLLFNFPSYTNLPISDSRGPTLYSSRNGSSGQQGELYVHRTDGILIGLA